ncbi:hypothetical protein [Janthinobacterium sp. PSPC1-1]|uniref:hypothetical protein n=1 Tax=Janthinobacterium sp. PSPC1-1 TaxID=2804581 RepID=UPI003CF83486
MTYSAQVFRVLIASPSDVDEEREIAVRTIQEWNDLNSAERQLVLLPLRWETHSSPEYGKRPQEVINRQVVDHCDLVVGIFWTRIGSPTGIADSGTIEEIDRVAKNGKPVMLYFSRAKKDPENIDLDQLGKLREFKKNTYPRALVENYSGPIEFKDKLSKQIELQLRTLLVEQSKEQPIGQNEIRPVTDIILSFAEDASGKEIGNSQAIKTQYLDITGFESIPDYGIFSDEKKSGLQTTPSSKRSLGLLMESQINKNYYRELLTNLAIGQYFKPLRFSLKNLGGVGARDVYIDLSISSSNGKISFISKSQMPKGRPGVSYFGLITETHPKHPHDLIGNANQGWTCHLEVPALQPQRKLSPETVFFIGAAESCEVIVTAKIFADTLASPVIQTLQLNIDVEIIESAAIDALRDIFITENRPEEVTSLNKILLEIENSDI